ncbi:hypothetical protein Prudu_016661 [Prunus dulcis]|uniref:Uncharacterized protein n=1 Tax=Prunus dulcis TaxID=3755 RepID=A0A4Y1RMZ9_PRUDU|nr:hypothetical protein Prudu_016661 [Prunus dulcis]
MQGHRSTWDPPPAIRSFRAVKWKILGLVKNTGETLPNFRQKSKGEFKARRSLVPDIRQVSDTYRAWAGFQRGNWVGSCHNSFEILSRCSDVLPYTEN